MKMLDDFKRQGLLILVSGPSGVGKGTIVERLLKERDDCVVSISATTRAPRVGEINGKSYHFISREQFDKWIEEGRFLEWDEHFGNCYGTPIEFVNCHRELGKHVILEIDVVGAKQVMGIVPGAVGIFIAPPSLKVWKDRLISRGTENEEQLQERFGRMREEIGFMDNYDYVIVNDDLEQAVSIAKEIIDVEMIRTERLCEDGVLKYIFGE